MTHLWYPSEHIVLSFAECIIARFDGFVNDVIKEFAGMLQMDKSNTAYNSAQMRYNIKNYRVKER